MDKAQHNAPKRPPTESSPIGTRVTSPPAVDTAGRSSNVFEHDFQVKAVWAGGVADFLTVRGNRFERERLAHPLGGLHSDAQMIGLETDAHRHAGDHLSVLYKARSVRVNTLAMERMSRDRAKSAI